MIGKIIMYVITFLAGIVCFLKPKFVWDVTKKSICINDCVPPNWRLLEIRINGVAFIFGVIYLVISDIVKCFT